MKGLTLIELVIVTVIIAIISGITMVSWRTTRESLALDREAYVIAQNIRGAMNSALRADESISCSSGNLSGYGVHFDSSAPDSYILFAECNDTNEYQAGQDEVVRTINFEQGFELKRVRPDPLSVTFSPPEPSVSISGGNASGIIVLAPQNAVIVGYEYWHTGDVPGHQNPRANHPPYCVDPNQAQINCFDFPFPASQSDPNVLYDQYCTINCSPPNRWSQEIVKIPLYSPTRIISVSAKGVIEVQ